MSAVKTKIPRAPAQLRAYLAIHRIPRSAVAEAYGCGRAWISMVLNEDRVATELVLEKLREAIAQVEEERCQRRVAS